MQKKRKKSQKVKGGNNLLTDEWITDKQTVVYTCNGIPFSLIKEWNSESCFNMGEPWKHYAKSNKPNKKGKLLYDSTYIGM